MTCFRNSKGVGHRQAIKNGASHLLRKDCRTKVHAGSSEQAKSDRSCSNPASLSLRIRQAGARNQIFECGTGGGKSFGNFRSGAGRKSCRQFLRTSRHFGGKELALRSRNCAESSRKRTGCSAVTVQWLPWKWETCANRRKASRPGFAPSVKRRFRQASACRNVQQNPPRKGSSIGTWVLSGP